MFSYAEFYSVFVDSFCLSTKYPSESEHVESEIKNLKRKLEIVDDEFSDCDEEQLVHQFEKIEREIKKPKLNFIASTFKPP
jgi:hypothetical protein